MTNSDEIRKFILEAGKVDYSTGNEDFQKKETDGSLTIKYQNGDWQFRDNWFGGEPFAGQTVIWYKEEPIWTNVYYGGIHPKVEKSKEVLKFLQLALKNAPEDLPIRGPSEFHQGEFRYLNVIQGELENFAGQEVIFQNGKEVYKAQYMGGLVDQRND